MGISKDLIILLFRIHRMGRTCYSYAPLLMEFTSRDHSLISEPPSVELATLGNSFDSLQLTFIICKMSVLHLYNMLFFFLHDPL